MLRINQQFDSGNIEVIACNHADEIRLAIRSDTRSDFFQWFHFRVSGCDDQVLVMTIENAAAAAFTGGWENYQAFASYDQDYWFRVPTTRYIDGQLIIEHQPEHDSVYYAYFVPYSQQRHLQTIGYAQQEDNCRHEVLGQSLQGRDIDLLCVGDEQTAKQCVWVIARQHPGESMAEWFVEGLLMRLLDKHDALAETLLAHTCFYIVPNMNPDGSILGHLRCNAAGINLNREWKDPSMEKSPEVYCVREKLQVTGCDLFLDIHGDETLPWNFIAGQEGTDATPAILAQEKAFEEWFKMASPDFQLEHGYPPNKYGPETLTLASKWVGHHFGIPSMTLEMPFKDNQARPDVVQGWSAERSLKLGEAILLPIERLLDK